MNKIKQNNFLKSPYFKIDTFTAYEKKITPFITVTITAIYFFIFGISFGGISFMVSFIPNPFVDFIGNWPVIFSVSSFFVLGCLLTSIFTKVVFNYLIGYIYHMKPLTIMDDVYLFDFPANPINIPTFIIF